MIFKKFSGVFVIDVMHPEYVAWDEDINILVVNDVIKLKRDDAPFDDLYHFFEQTLGFGCHAIRINFNDEVVSYYDENAVFIKEETFDYIINQSYS